MGTITTLKRDGKQVMVNMLIEYDEILKLKGHINDIHLFSENVFTHKTNISQRGKNNSTKYFLIPRQLRKDLNFEQKVSCQRINAPDKTIFIYIVNITLRIVY